LKRQRTIAFQDFVHLEDATAHNDAACSGVGGLDSEPDRPVNRARLELRAELDVIVTDSGDASTNWY